MDIRNNYKPQLKKPVAYLVLPDNVVSINGQQLGQNIQVTTGDGHQVINPKAVSLQVIDGHQVIMVDLSNYNNLYDGFDVTVKGLSNVPDWQTTTKPVAMLVASKQFANNNTHFLKQRATVDTYQGTFKSLFKTIAQNDHLAAANTLIDENGHWDIVVAKGATVGTMTSTTDQPAPALQTSQSDHTGNQMKVYNSIINGQNIPLPNVKSVIDLDDGQTTGHFASILTGPATVINMSTNQPASGITIRYATQNYDLKNLTDAQLAQFKTADQITDWSKVKALLVTADNVAANTTYRTVMPIQDRHIYDDVNKVTQVTSNTWSTNSDGSMGLKPVVINMQSPVSAKIKINGQSTIKTVIRYTDAQGTSHDVVLTDQNHQYQEGKDQMKRSDFLQSDHDLTELDRSQLPAHLVIDYAHPTIENSHESYLNDYANGTAAFGQTAKYDFDQDAVVFKAVIGTPITAKHTVKETIHYVYADGSKAHDDTESSHDFTGTGYKDPQTGRIVWNGSADSYEFPAVTVPDKAGYTFKVSPTANYDAANSQIKSITVNNASSDVEYTVTYTPIKQTIDYQIVDDNNSGNILKSANLASGNSASDVPASAKTDLQQVVNGYLGQGYVLKDSYLVPTKFDTDDQDNQTVTVHLLHGTTVSSEPKTVTRTIAYYDQTTGAKLPDTLVKHDPQTVSFTRTAVTDTVTHQLIGYNTSGDYTEYQGANGQQVKVYKVDQTNGDQAWQASDPDWASVTNPDLRSHGYEPATDESGTAMPTIARITVGANDDDQTVKVYYAEHVVPVNATTKVTADQPVGKDGPYQWPAKTNFDARDYQSQSTRQISYQYSNGGQASNPVTETVTFNRTGKLNLVTGAVVPNNDWMATSSTINQSGRTTSGQDVHKYEVVASPEIHGYTADQLSVPAVKAQQGQNAKDVVVTYKADPQKLTYTIKDETTGTTLKDKAALENGVSDQTISSDTQRTYQTIVKQYQDQGYVVVADKLPAKYDHDDQTDQNVFLHLYHKVQRVTGTDQKLPDKSKLSLSDLKKTATLEVNYVNNDGSIFTGHVPTNARQQVTLIGTAYIDLVTGKLTNAPVKDQQGNEIVDSANHDTPTINWQSATTQAVPSPAETGYHTTTPQLAPLTITVDNDANQDQGLTDGATVTLTKGTTTAKITRAIKYAKDPTVEVKYVDQDNDGAEIPGTGSKVLTGTAGQTVDYKTASTLNSLKQQGYVLVDNGNGFDPTGEAPKYGDDDKPTVTYTVTLKHATIMVQPNKPKTPKDTLPDHPGQKYPKGVDHDDLNKSVTRWISLHRPNGITDNTTQTVHFTRTAIVDEVTGHVDHGEWTIKKGTTDKWAAYQTPSLSGYTPTVTHLSMVPVNYKMNNQTVDISYTPHQQTIDYRIIDDNTRTMISGNQPVHLVKGLSDHGVPTEAHQKLDQIIRDCQKHGYVLVSGNQVPNQFDHDDDDNQLITVHVKHAKIVVTPDQTKTTQDPLPDNPGKKYPTGVDHDNLNQTITRTINLHLPDGSIKTIHQDAHLTRTATVDEVTGQVVYGPWTTTNWPVYDVPTISGYTPSQSFIRTATVTQTTTSTTVDVYYSAIPQPKNGQLSGQHSGVVNNDRGAHRQNTASSQSQRLPQTGNQAAQATVGIGLSALLSMVGLLSVGRRKKNH
ncbi:mucin-binding protein [uncultured Limosilactobacillus sp.]|uniref:mucin-binding protein n=1 Tax=uncultured Limosilactobacillus sp. TaxID=2837629 RepID=UPI0025CC48A9|nr:LPXTG cell wall anchor domain-containing protein [uncultured Limosilactobacillus sp.]